MKKQNNRQEYNTTYQLKLLVEISTIIEISDPVYTFCEVMDRIDLRKYLAVKESKTGRKRYNPLILLKVILFAFMEYGYVSVRKIEKLCKTDIRFMWLLQDNAPPSHMTIDNFMNETLLGNIEDIFAEINGYIFLKGKVDTEHIYIDGSKIPANAYKYGWVWKKSCLKNRNKTFEKITLLLGEINETVACRCVKFGIRTEYAIEYMEQITEQYKSLMSVNPETVVRGRGHHKSAEQRNYDKLVEYTNKLKKYAEHIKICGDERNSYSKTDNDATFMRMKKRLYGQRSAFTWVQYSAWNMR